MYKRQAVYCDDRLGIYAAGVVDGAGRSGERYRRYICLIPARFAAEIDRKRAMRIPAQYLFKTDLVGDAGVVKPALPVSEGDFAAALEPRGNCGNFRGVSEKALRGEHHVLVDVISLQGGQAARPAGDVGIRRALGGDGRRRQLGDVNVILRAPDAVPFEPIIQLNILLNILSLLLHCLTLDNPHKAYYILAFRNGLQHE